MGIIYQPRQQFLPFHNREARWATVLTHRRAGKTVALANDAIIGALSSPTYRPQVAYIGPTFTQAKRIAWQYLKDYADPFLAKPPSESELKLTLKNEAVLYCLGADNPDSLRGMYLDGAVMDEYALFRPSVFTQIIRPALSDRNGWGVFASTPRGRNLFHKVVRESELSNDPLKWFHLRLAADTSGIIPAAELRELQTHMDAEEFAQEYLCSFDSALKGAIFASEVNQMMAEGRVYNQDGDPNDALYNPNLPTHFVYDLGFTDAMVRIAFQYTAMGGINVVNVEATTGADIFYHIDSLHSFADAVRSAGSTLGGIGEVWLPHDARAKNLQTGKSVVEQFLDNGITPRLVPDHHVKDGIAAARKVLPMVTIDLTPTSDPEVPVTGDLLEALKAYRREWDEDHQIFSEKPLHDWASDFADAFRYMCVVAAPNLYLSESTSDEARASRLARAKDNRPHIGYNLETLHADAAIRSQEPRRMQ